MTTQVRFSLENLIKLESSFQRLENLPEDYENTLPEIQFQMSWGREQDMVRVYLTIELDQANNEKPYVNGKVVMLGYFKMSGDLPESVVKDFCEINAQAILFPFIREEFATSSIKAGLRSILLQPVNFVEMAKQSQQQIPQPQEGQK